MPLPPTVDARVEISWDGSGAFTGPYDDVTADVFGTPGLTVEGGRDGAQTLSPPRINAAGFSLENDDGRYSQERPDSPVYQRVLPGRPVQVRVGFGERVVYRSHERYRAHLPYRGRASYLWGRYLIDQLSQETAVGTRAVAVAALGYESVLTKAKVSIGVMANPRVDQCFTALLDAVGWPSDKRAVDVADTTLLWWWCDERAPWDAMLELLAAEGPGYFGVDREGVFRFESRNHRITAPRSTTSQADLWDITSGQQTLYRSHALYRSHIGYRGRLAGTYFTRLSYDPGFKSVYNRATYPTTRRALGSLGMVWQYGTPFSLSGGQSRTLIARPSDPFQNAVVPALGTDYTVSGGPVTVTLSATSGLVAFITITATGGSTTVSGPTASPTTGLQLRAQPLAVVSQTTVTNSIDASESIAKYSPIPGADIPITLDLAAWPELDVAMAEAVCNAWVVKQQIPRALITVTLRNATAAQLEQVFRRAVSDRVTIHERNTGLTGDAWINAVAITVSGAGGRVIEAVLQCERTDEAAGAVWDLSRWDDAAAIWGI
jgi:hypothetical protein